MTSEEFRTALRELGLPHGAPLTSRLLGVSSRQISFYLAGHNAVARPVANLVRFLLTSHRAGVPPAAVAALIEGAAKGRPGVHIAGKFRRGHKKSRGASRPANRQRGPWES